MSQAVKHALMCDMLELEDLRLINFKRNRPRTGSLLMPAMKPVYGLWSITFTLGSNCGRSPCPQVFGPYDCLYTRTVAISRAVEIDLGNWTTL